MPLFLIIFSVGLVSHLQAKILLLWRDMSHCPTCLEVNVLVDIVCRGIAWLCNYDSTSSRSALQYPDSRISAKPSRQDPWLIQYGGAINYHSLFCAYRLSVCCLWRGWVRALLLLMLYNLIGAPLIAIFCYAGYFRWPSVMLPRETKLLIVGHYCGRPMSARSAARLKTTWNKNKLIYLVHLSIGEEFLVLFTPGKNQPFL